MNGVPYFGPSVVDYWEQPGRYAIYDDGTTRRAINDAANDHVEANPIVHGVRDELDRLITAELGNTHDIIIGYDQAIVRGAVATDDGEGHG
jgi:hypothetical protein